MRSTIQNLLYKYPMFDYMAAGENEINVLVLGWNKSASEFLSLILPTGQLYGCHLNITVCSSDPSAHAKAYCDPNPGLSGFVSITVDDASFSSPAVPYAMLSFVRQQKDPDILLSHHFCYIFVCDNCDDQAAADVFSGIFSGVNTLLIRESGEKISVFSENGYQTVDELTENPVDGLSLTDMAFNTHLLWWDGANGDIDEERTKFLDQGNDYYRLSSRSYVLSIPYKLWSIGLGASNGEGSAFRFHYAVNTALQFDELMKNDLDRTLFNRLLWMERRRWVLEKVTDGFTGAAEEDFQEFADKATVKIGKKNVCITHSTESTPLSGDEFSGDNRYRWDVPGEWDNGLDDLDHMSAELHRFMMTKAENLKKSNYIHDPDQPVMKLNELIRKIRRAYIALLHNVQLKADPLQIEFNRLSFCVHSILDGNAVYAEQYRNFCSDFMNVFDEMIEDVSSQPEYEEWKNEAKEQIEKLSHDLFPAIEAAAYRNYKKTDEILIRNIPFILTRKHGMKLAMPFNAVRNKADINNSIFDNVASPLVIQPKMILYLFRASPEDNPVIFSEMFESCRKFLRNNNIHCEIRLAVSFAPDIPSGKMKKWQKVFKSLESRDVPVSVYQNKNKEEITFFFDLMSDLEIDLFDNDVPLFESRIMDFQWMKKILDPFACFTMNTASQRFDTDPKCVWLKFLQSRSILRVDDIFLLMNSQNRKHHYPDYYEMVKSKDNRENGFEPLYKRLWKIYTGESMNLAREQSVYYWNSLCNELGADKRNCISSLCSNGGADISKIICGSANAKNAYIRILEEIAAIVPVYQNTALLVINRDQSGEITSIRTDKKNIAEIITNAGAILEAYTFFRAFETGFFDDIVCGYEFYWGDHDLPNSCRNNEIDLVLTKGFRSLFIECKATAELDQEYFHKLNSIADLFSINAIKVLIHNDYSRGTQNQMTNTDQRERGSLMDIKTVYNDSNIDDIGNILANFLRDR